MFIAHLLNKPAVTWIGRITFAVLVGSTLASAGSTKFISTWKNPAAGRIGLAGKKVAAFVIALDPSLREGREETLAEELRGRGLNCFAGYAVLPAELAKDPEKSKEFVKKAGVAGAILMRVVGVEERAYYTPTWYAAPYYASFWGYWNYAWSAVYAPGYLSTDTVVSIEVLIYSVEDDTLLWAGKSETTNPKDIRKFAEDLVNTLGKELRKSGLVAK